MRVERGVVMPTEAPLLCRLDDLGLSMNTGVGIFEADEDVPADAGVVDVVALVVEDGVVDAFFFAFSRRFSTDV